MDRISCLSLPGTALARVAMALLCPVIFHIAPVLAQAPNVLWAVSSYGPATVEAGLGCSGCSSDKRAMAVDAAGNVVVSGYANLATGFDWKTTKFNGATGAVLWESVFNGTGSGDDHAYAMTLDSSGNVIVTGYQWNGTDGDIKVIKYAGATGAILWQASVAGSPGGNDFGIYVATDTAGNVFVGGSTWNGTNDDMRTVKYAAATGAVIWDKTFAGPGNGPDYVFALAVDTAGNVIVTGESQTGTTANPDWKTIKYAAADGTILWQATFAGTAGGLDIPTSVAIDSAGNAVVAGYTFNGTNSDMKIIKYAAANGAILWQNGFAGTGNGDDQIYDVALDAAGNAIATGFSFNGTSNDWKTIKFAAATGAIMWEKTFAGTGNGSDISVVVTVDANGNAIVGGRNANGADRNMRVVSYAAADGTIIWQYDYSGSAAGGFDRAAALAVVPGAVFVAGESTETGKPLGWRIVKIDNASVPLALSSVASRKTHGTAGTFDLPIDMLAPISGTVTVEPRIIGTGHTIVFRFNVPVTSVGAVTSLDALSAPVGVATYVIAGNDVVVTLAGVPDNRRVKITLSNVNGAAVNASASMGFAVGDVSNTRAVDSSDISRTKARSGQALDISNYWFDVNTSGAINSSDISAVKARSGLTLPP